jgi:hypothetical protein
MNRGRCEIGGGGREVSERVRFQIPLYILSRWSCSPSTTRFAPPDVSTLPLSAGSASGVMTRSMTELYPATH